MKYILFLIVSLILGLYDGDCTVFVILAIFGAVKAVTEGIELLRSKKNRKTKKGELCRLAVFGHQKQKEGEKMRYYYTCDVCGANLDPGERCSDCEERQTIKKTSATLVENEAEAQTIQKTVSNKQVYYNTTRSKCQGLRELFVR